MRPRPRFRRGATLVELLLAALILGFAAPAIIGAQNASFSTARNLQRRAYALSLAQSAVENARAKCEDASIATGTATSKVDNAILAASFTTTVTVTNPKYDLAQIEVKVAWTERRGGKDVTDDVRLGTLQRTTASL